MLVRPVQCRFRAEYECKIVLLTPTFIGIQLDLDSMQITYFWSHQRHW